MSERTYTKQEIEKYLDAECVFHEEEHNSNRDMLAYLLFKVIDEGEMFSGKRPLGDSNFQWEFASGIGHNLDKEVVTEWGEKYEDCPVCADEVDWKRFNNALRQILSYVFGTKKEIEAAEESDIYT